MQEPKQAAAGFLGFLFLGSTKEDHRQLRNGFCCHPLLFVVRFFEFGNLLFNWSDLGFQADFVFLDEWSDLLFELINLLGGALGCEQGRCGFLKHGRQMDRKRNKTVLTSMKR